MPYLVYKLLHVAGVLMVLVAVGGVAVHAANGGRREDNSLRGLLAAMHGIGLILSVVAGFGMLGASFPGWAWAKLVIWLVFGAALPLPYRSQALARSLVVILPLLAAVAAWLALYKPF